jgi:hypothetical protein
MLVEKDSRGVDALAGGEVLLPEVIWFQIVDELGPVPAAPHIEPFDDQPWLDMWDAHPVELPLDALIHELGMRAHGEGPDFMKFMATQRFMAQVELDLIKERQAADVAAGSDDVGEVEGDAGDGAAAAFGGGGVVSGESEDGDTVVEGGAAEGDSDTGRPPKVQRRRRAGKVA